jgi:hypothetical protein
MQAYVMLTSLKSPIIPSSIVLSGTAYATYRPPLSRHWTRRSIPATTTISLLSKIWPSTPKSRRSKGTLRKSRKKTSPSSEVFGSDSHLERMVLVSRRILMLLGNMTTVVPWLQSFDRQEIYDRFFDCPLELLCADTCIVYQYTSRVTPTDASTTKRDH